jgi:hypothetical protein
MLVAAVVAVLVVASVGLKALLEAAHQEAFSRVVSRHRVTAVIVSAPAGSVTVRAGRAGQVAIGITRSWVFSFSKPRIRRTWAGTTLTITASCPQPDLFGDCGVGLDLAVPSGTAVTAAVTSGSVLAENLADSLRLLASTGQVTVVAARGPVWARVTSGEISGSALDSPQVNATAGSGAVSLAYAVPPWQVTARAGAGSVLVTLPSSRYRYRVQGRTGSGSRSIDGALVDAASRRVITVTTGSGNVMVSSPAAAPSAASPGHA